MQVRTNYNINLHNYAEALLYHNGIVPISRGKDKGLKPLFGHRNYASGAELKSGRNKKQSNIRKDGVGGRDVVVRLYETDVLVFKPDDTIVCNVQGWNSCSTNNVIGAVLGAHVMSVNNKIWLIHNYIGSGWNENAKYLHHTGDNILKYNGESFDVTPSELPTRKVVNRQAAKTVMRDYQEFREYARGMLKLHPMEDKKYKFTADEVSEYEYLSMSLISELAKNGNSAEQFGRAYMGCIRHGGVTTQWGVSGSYFEVTVDKIMCVIRKAAYTANSDTVMETQVVTDPTKGKSTYDC